MQEHDTSQEATIRATNLAQETIINHQAAKDKYWGWSCLKCGLPPIGERNGEPYCRKHLSDPIVPRIRKGKYSGYSKSGDVFQRAKR